MRQAICILCFLVTGYFGMAQTSERDSLVKRVPFMKNDTGKVTLLLKIAADYETNNQDSCLFYLNVSKRLADSLKFKPGLFHYFIQRFIVSLTKGEYNLSLEHIKKALALAEELKDSTFIVISLANTGLIFQYIGDYNQALEYSLRALEMVERQNLTEKLGPMYEMISGVYYNLSQYRRSIEYGLLSLKFQQQTGVYNYINRTYSSLGQSYEMISKPDSALYYYKIAISESVASNDKYAEASVYWFMAEAYADLGDFKEMLKVSEKSLEMARALQSRQLLSSSLYNLAYARYINGDIATAKKNIYEAMAIAEKDSLQEELKNSYVVLSYIAAKEGDFRTAVRSRQRYDSIRNVVLNEQVIKATTALEKKYESEKKDKQILLQESQLRERKIINNILIGSALILLVISLLSFRNYQQKQTLQLQRINELEKEKQLTAAEAVLKGEDQERTRLAKDLHDGLGGMLSGIKYSFQSMKGNLVMTPGNAQAFERSMDMLDSSIQEMRRVAHNMMPEGLVKFGLDTALKDFCNDINLSGAIQVNYQSIGMEVSAIDQTTAITIYRIVQELINNVLKHAAAKTALVQVTRNEGRLTITVEDDGKGFDTMLLSRAKGIGWSNIQNRVDFLKGKLDISSVQGTGTSVHIELNI
jgi:two-component system, NarL family, sensor kinase